MTTDWHYISGGQQQGPVSSEQLRQLAATGQLASDDLVWKEGMDDWMPASKVKGLGLNAAPPKPAASVPPPIPAPPPLTPSQNPTTGPLEAAKAGLAGLTFDWKNWDVGGKTVFLAACTAVLSMVMNWVQLGPISANGFFQGTFLFLGVFVYPVLMLLRQRPIHRKAGIACAVGGVVLALGYIASKSGEVFGQSVTLAGAGPVVFLLASVALLVGILKYASLHGSLAAPTDPATDAVSEALRGIGGKIRAAAESERTKAAGEKVKGVATKAAASVDQFVHSEAVQSRIAAAKAKWLGLTQKQRILAASASGFGLLLMLFLLWPTGSDTATADSVPVVAERYVETEYTPAIFPPPFDSLDYGDGGNGEDHGPVTLWYEAPASSEKQRRQETYYFNGFLHGPHRQWHPNGQLEISGFYYEDKEHGRWQYWYEDGTPALIEDYEKGQLNGVAAVYRESGVLQSLVHWSQGEKHGTTKRFNASGDCIVTCEYMNGEWTPEFDVSRLSVDKFRDKIRLIFSDGDFEAGPPLRASGLAVLWEEAFGLPHKNPPSQRIGPGGIVGAIRQWTYRCRDAQVCFDVMIYHGEVGRIEVQEAAVVPVQSEPETVSSALAGFTARALEVMGRPSSEKPRHPPGSRADLLEALVVLGGDYRREVPTREGVEHYVFLSCPLKKWKTVFGSPGDISEERVVGSRGESFGYSAQFRIDCIDGPVTIAGGGILPLEDGPHLRVTRVIFH